MSGRHRIHRVLKNCALIGVAGVIVCLIVACTGAPFSPPPTAPVVPFRRTLRLFWVNSYNAEDVSFQKLQASALMTLSEAGYSADTGMLNMDVYHMNAARFPSLSSLEPVADVAIARIAAFNPDIVVVSGDAATLSVIPRYPDLHKPFIFCDMIGNPNVPGLRRPAVRGVLANPHPLRTIAMARSFLAEAADSEAPNPVERFLILGDASIAGQSALASTYRALRELEKGDGPTPTVEVINEWEEWQEIAAEAAQTYDFILLLGYKSVRDAEGVVLPSDELMAWMVEHVSIPIFSLSNEAVVNGAVGGLVMNQENQGEAVGRMMIRIAQGAHPSSLTERSASPNLLAINLAAARRWNLPIPIAFPLAGRVYRELPAAESIAPESGQKFNHLAHLAHFNRNPWYHYGYNPDSDPGILAEHNRWMSRGGP